MYKKLPAILLLICIFNTSFGSNRIEIQLRSLATQYLKTHGQDENISAISIAVSKDNSSQIITVNKGTMAHHSAIEINKNNVFQIGSITKSFIAALLLRLQERYGFTLNDPVTKFLPDYREWQDVKLINLLNMTSGIRDYFKHRHLLAMYSQYPFRNYGMKQWVDHIYKTKPLFKPGEKFDYSNTNYLILGLIIEKLTQKSLAQNLEIEFIKPLHLNHTFYLEHLPSNRLQDKLVHGYQYEDGLNDFIPKGRDVTDYSLSYMTAAGGLISNSEDIAKWTKALFTEGKVLSTTNYKIFMNDLVSQTNGKIVNELSPNSNLSYGLGIQAQYSNNLKKPIYFYQGMTLGYRALMMYIPGSVLLAGGSHSSLKGITIAITVNSSFDGKSNHLIGLLNQVSALLVR